ncbi:hypothetical protein P153DRAFT_330168 [Dothidotthia symphoricarpi CBS 119687]|uniref:ubiquitinyl hydrolase 1 n=1 Tax=Dothidotthia symphoricarpi CBS 119687 TaxID=1392245 RepID=A0A6A6ANZ6_9PLEO|nr:uncharacterized protein P153DRAFT_330168 [Dothidotthia symphoricarpi CBS 119687]KAF2133722.1 hypothetical protein P153DRAFT_330168 [Dothidotthia symphoricarpi CBS 119687]
MLPLYHHVVLPRDVPGREDKNLYQTETELALNVDGKIDKHLLIKELQQLSAKQALILHVTEQNAALMVYRQSNGDGRHSVVFEVFETSATCEKVLACEGALQWDFPGQAVSIPYRTFSDEDFQQSLAAFLEQASLESVTRFSAVTYKACAPLPEIRDTPNPTLITNFFMTILEASGVIYSPPLLRKRIRDTVSFNKAYKPWRRSPFYLVLRVAMQRHLYTLLGAEKGRQIFKIVMCVFLSKLLDDTLGFIPDEASHFFRQKLGRRLAKLEMDRGKGSKVLKQTHDHVFRFIRPVMEKSLLTATRFLESRWDAYKKRTSRIVRPIQQYASTHDLTLQLPLSGQTFVRSMHLRSSTAQSEIRSPDELLSQYENTIAIKPFAVVFCQFMPLYQYEEEVTNSLRMADERGDMGSSIHLARTINTYISTVKDTYADYPELRSCQLLSLMELWVALDQHTVACFPLLREYHPGFEASMLDVLQLSKLDEVRRLQDVQLYIAGRCGGWSGQGSKTVFDTPAEDSYAVRYYDEPNQAEEFQELRRLIEEEANQLIDVKEEEWEEKSQIHDAMINEMAGLSCLYVMESDENGFLRQVHKTPCRKHTLKWKARQITIDIFEYPLPKSEPAVKAVIFELICPKAFALYRDATWCIMSSFAYPQKEPEVDTYLLRNYSGLCDYANRQETRVSLGSSTKSHLDSHYATSGFPLPMRDVCRPFGMKMDYYDTSGQTWISRDGNPSFAHLFPLKLPKASPYHAFTHIGEKWPSSNRILATQTKCPPDLSAHEYMAWQGLLLGTYSRWPCLLRELGSTNLNFSTDSTWAVVSKLVLEVGPATSEDTLRDTHAVFHERSFCERLLEQIDHRLEAVRRNWREPVQMDILISMLLKVRLFTSNMDMREVASSLLLTARAITQSWVEALRSAENSVFIIWAPLLCKRTFYPDLDDCYHVPSEDLESFIIASIVLQNNLVGKFDDLPYNLRNAILQDLRYTYEHSGLLHQCIGADSQVLVKALKAFWSVPAECMDAPTISQVDLQPWWTCLTLSAKYMQHRILYNCLNGVLLINGQQLGILPSEYRRDPIIEELFGTQDLPVYPSSLPGMSLLINRPMPCGHWVHLGFRADKLVIRAEYRDIILELISRNAFGNERQFDLPVPLSMGCFHWLNLKTGVLEIRPQDPWKSKLSNWRLDLNTRQATRNNGSTLVDPNSELAKRIAQNFHQFEYPYHITVYQPMRGNLRVELKRLDLDFVVTNHGLLLCPQLGAIIAESRLQDFGTWYGLRSKLVVRSIKDASQLHVLLPFGEPVRERDGQHVSIVIKNNGGYWKFGVNNLLGRIDCSAEPVLLYHKAMWHASTAHFLPDRLTGRTGVEEALHYLKSGTYQPWTPLAKSACDVLSSIADLSPHRAYYPKTMAAMETVQWNPNLTTFMQDDRYKNACEAIFERNEDLRSFVLHGSHEPPPRAPREEHLEYRALTRIYANSSGCDQAYQSRDRRLENEERSNVAEMARTLSEWSSQVADPAQLASLLQKSPVIGGYVRMFDKIQITDIIDTDLGIDWGALAMTALECSKPDRFQLMFLFCLLVFSPCANVELVRVLVSFAVLDDLKQLELPKAAAYSHFQPNEVLEVETLERLISGFKKAFEDDNTHDGVHGQLVLRRLNHEKAATRSCKLFAESIRAQWPCRELNIYRLAIVDDVFLDRDEALLAVLPEWDRLVNNFEFSQHIEDVQLVLHRHCKGRLTSTIVLKTSSDLLQTELYPLRKRGGEVPTMQELLRKDLSVHVSHKKELSRQAVPPIVLTNLTNGVRAMTTLNTTPGASRKFLHINELRRIVANYKNSSSLVQKRYGDELEQSIKALLDHLSKPAVVREPFNPTKLSNELYAANDSFRAKLHHIASALQEGDSRAKWLKLAGMWPRITPTTLLTELRSTSGTVFGQGTRETLVSFGVAVTTYQRLLRIQDAIQRERRQQIRDESDNIGHQNWSPLKHVDWLVLEIDSNIMLRSEQVEVALATISPQSGQNSVVQMLMGAGKTSCILPMVALKLADKNLFRIVVPRPLLLQSAQIMQTKLGGLLNREVIHIPFSRKTPTGRDLMSKYCQLHTHTQKYGGIMLALPEHILSFKLSGLQRLCDGKPDEAAMMIKAQGWLDRHARDVLDECDVSLAIRTQLIYPSGTQQTVDGHPLRWQTTQALLHLVVSYLPGLAVKFPSSIEIVWRFGFPLIYLLRKDVEEYVVAQIVQAISKGQTTILPVADLPVSSQQDIQTFISSPSVSPEVTSRVVDVFTDSRHLMDVVYHLRGLFVHRILLSTLKKRWNVQYGLHPSRDPIAVPYQAKGIASPTAEWGHPDVAIILTCLSFYYEGLTMAQFKQAFEQLVKSDEPSIEYEKWVVGNVPEALRDYNAINVEDSNQLRELHQYIRHNVYLLDFFLNTFVFPLHAKQFSKKLSASGSDLVLFEPTRSSNCRTTGFSGTNDSRHQLPMTIKQNDLPQLAHTNAEVLAYLLEERNRHYVYMVDSRRKRLTEDGLLRKLQNPLGLAQNPSNRIRILLDAGAQVLEMDNCSLAKAWLKIDHEAAAAVYFDSDHRPRVIYGKGKGTDIPLVASPFADNLDECLVYIDENHCRGTDLRLPANARAGLTLGPNLTKDALAQAAMRLRLLGTTQSVTFFSPPEVHQSILDVRMAAKDAPITAVCSRDVVRWLLEQTCNAIEQLEPLYFTQGINFLQREQAKLNHPDFLDDEYSREAYLSIIRSKELQSLKQLYEPKHQQRGPAIKSSAFAPSLRKHVTEMLNRRKGFQDRGFAIHSSALEEVEQEREIEFETECVRETQPPVYFKALKTGKLHPDVQIFATIGRLAASSDAYEPMFCTLQKTALGIKHGNITATNVTPGLYVSAQFNRTISTNESNDAFLRPCQWILWSRAVEIGLLVSPEEANLLIPILRGIRRPVCHLITYAAPITRRMLHFNKLDYYAIPPLPTSFKIPIWLTVVLGIFAGRLYFDWDEYEETMAYLGIRTGDSGNDEESQGTQHEAFAEEPLAFLHDWLAIRRKGQDFEHTPMGFITTGKPLSADHPFFSTAEDKSELESKFSMAAHTTQITEEDEESDDDEDHGKEHLFQHNGDDDGGMDMHDDEDDYDDEENIFFAGGAYVEGDVGRQ